MLRMKIMELEDMWHPTARNTVEFLRYMVCVSVQSVESKAKRAREMWKAKSDDASWLKKVIGTYAVLFPDENILRIHHASRIGLATQNSELPSPCTFLYYWLMQYSMHEALSLLLLIYHLAAVL